MIIYKTHGEFEETNIVLEELPEAVGAFAETIQNRMVLPIDQPPDKLYKLIVARAHPHLPVLAVLRGVHRACAARAHPDLAHALVDLARVYSPTASVPLPRDALVCRPRSWPRSTTYAALLWLRRACVGRSCTNRSSARVPPATVRVERVMPCACAVKILEYARADEECLVDHLTSSCSCGLDLDTAGFLGLETNALGFDTRRLECPFGFGLQSVDGSLDRGNGCGRPPLRLPRLRRAIIASASLRRAVGVLSPASRTSCVGAVGALRLDVCRRLTGDLSGRGAVSSPSSRRSAGLHRDATRPASLPSTACRAARGSAALGGRLASRSSSATRRRKGANVVRRRNLGTPVGTWLRVIASGFEVGRTRFDVTVGRQTSPSIVRPLGLVRGRGRRDLYRTSALEVAR